MNTVNVGVVGCGAISGAYLGMAKNFPAVRIEAVADLDAARAKAQADKFGVQRVLTVDEIFADKKIEIILNLTIPAAHLPLAIRAIEAGKHTYLEKPLGIDREEGKKLVALAKAKNLRVGCAPDTFMGAGIQTARKLIDDGVIGKPVAFTAFMMGRGHEHWHPSPEFYYAPGGGPMFDMGPYYLTALLQLLGPMKRVTGFASIAIPERTITSAAKNGQKINVTTPDHVTGSIEFVNGAVGTIIQSFATRAAQYDGRQPIQIFGTKGALKVPDPNGFDGPVQLCTFADKDEWKEVPHTFVTGYGRSVGLADMAVAIRNNRPHRASLEQAFTVLDAMQGFLDASKTGKAVDIMPGYERTAPMKATLPFGQLD
ncbi:MAG: Gfo/Idh/MocA family oxidoreductase [Tepidisphaeraceae bacterium]